MTNRMKNRDLKLSLEMTQTTGESDPSRGLLKTQGSQGSCNRGHQCHEGGPTKGLPMVTHYQSPKSGPIRG